MTLRSQMTGAPNPTSVYALEPGVVYVVSKPITDYHGGRFEVGELLTFEGRHYLPYHGGHTIVFREKALYLQEDEQADILGAMAEHLSVHDASGRRRPDPPSLPPENRKVAGLDFLGSLLMVLLIIAVWILKGRTDFVTWLGFALFGTAAFFSGRDWWRARRR